MMHASQQLLARTRGERGYPDNEVRAWAKNREDLAVAVRRGTQTTRDAPAARSSCHQCRRGSLESAGALVAQPAGLFPALHVGRDAASEQTRG